MSLVWPQIFGTIEAARRMHANLLKNVLRWSSTFQFDSIPQTYPTRVFYIFIIDN